MIIAWRWSKMQGTKWETVDVKQSSTANFERHLIKVKEPASPRPNEDMTLASIQARIRECTPNPDDEVLVFLHEQTVNKSENGREIYEGYKQKSRYDILAMDKGNRPNKPTVRCVLFGQKSFLYENLLDSSGGFGIRKNKDQDGKTVYGYIFDEGLVDDTAFDKVWRHYTEEYIEHAEHIRSIFKDCLNHWLEIPKSKNEKVHSMVYWKELLEENPTLYSKFSMFLKFNSNEKITETHNNDEKIYQRSIAYIASNKEAKQAYDELKNIINPPPNSKRVFSLRDIHARMDLIRRQLA